MGKDSLQFQPETHPEKLDEEVLKLLNKIKSFVLEEKKDILKRKRKEKIIKQKPFFWLAAIMKKDKQQNSLLLRQEKSLTKRWFKRY